jgi:hypothetical protein
MKMTIEEQLSAYGQVLTGEETALDIVKLERMQYLGKNKLRRLLDLIPLGDAQDCLADLTKTCILGWAIQQGTVTDPAIIARFRGAITAGLELYGGPDYIMGKLESNFQKLALMGRWYAARDAIRAVPEGSDAEDQVRAIDIEDVPATDLLP